MDKAVVVGAEQLGVAQVGPAALGPGDVVVGVAQVAGDVAAGWCWQWRCSMIAARRWAAVWKRCLRPRARTSPLAFIQAGMTPAPQARRRYSVGLILVPVSRVAALILPCEDLPVADGDDGGVEAADLGQLGGVVGLDPLDERLTQPLG